MKRSLKHFSSIYQTTRLPLSSLVHRICLTKPSNRTCGVWIVLARATCLTSACNIISWPFVRSVPESLCYDKNVSTSISCHKCWQLTTHKVAEQLTHLISPMCPEFESHVHPVKSTWIAMLPASWSRCTHLCVCCYPFVKCMSTFGSHLSFGAFLLFLKLWAHCCQLTVWLLSSYTYHHNSKSSPFLYQFVACPQSPVSSSFICHSGGFSFKTKITLFLEISP